MPETAPHRDHVARFLAAPPAVMGILNVTPDSFSDGGQWYEHEHAVSQAARLAQEGADILDLGGESTRPGSTPLDAESEFARVMPVLTQVVAHHPDLPISIDTYKAKVAEQAIRAGASIINDVWALQRDPDMAAVAAQYDVPVILMHNREAVDPNLDVWADMARFFDRSLALAQKAGIASSRIILDPGIGFGKNTPQNLLILSQLERMKTFGLPFLMGLSRKRFIGDILNKPVDQRLFGTIAANMQAVEAGAVIIRVHDVLPHVEALAVRHAILNAGH